MDFPARTNGSDLVPEGRAPALNDFPGKKAF